MNFKIKLLILLISLIYLQNSSNLSEPAVHNTFVSQSPKISFVFHLKGYILDCISFNYITPSGFFEPESANGLPLETGTQQVFSRLQDSSQYSDRPRKWCSFGWFRLVLRFLSLPAFLLILRRAFQVRQLQLVSPKPSCFLAFLVLWQGTFIFPSFRFLWFSKSTIRQVLFFYLFFLLIISRCGLWCIYDLVVSSNFSFLPNSKWITFPAHSCLVLNNLFFCLQLD